MLEYKCRWHGANLVIVDPTDTSRACNRCGLISADSLVTRSHYVCVGCGYESDADVNAAKNARRDKFNRRTSGDGL
jgi:putative transposase